jgi:hypothetical protein
MSYQIDPYWMSVEPKILSRRARMQATHSLELSTCETLQLNNTSHTIDLAGYCSIYVLMIMMMLLWKRFA